VIGVVVPAHNEEAYLDACLGALSRATSHAALAGEEVRIVVVLDACTDGSRAIAANHHVIAIEADVRNVGAARCRGAARLLAEGARWLAFTDADTLVSESWLSDQLSLGVDAVCGCVTVEDWSEHVPQVRARYDLHYQHRDGHCHVHGANLGISAAAYTKAGGFSPLQVSEDVALINALIEAGAHVAWSALPTVVTSARRRARATGGFATFLMSLEKGGDLAA
jgi:glycosyltransferase involved in cell wall biosynthesis